MPSGGQVEMLPIDGQGSKRMSWRKSSDITMMILRWESQEVEEKTTMLEMVRGRRRSTNIDKIVQELNLESKEIIQTSEETELRYSWGGDENTFSLFSFVQDGVLESRVNLKPKPKQTISLRNMQETGGDKRKSESMDYGGRPAKRLRGSSD